MMKALIGETPPPWIGVHSLAVEQSNILAAYGEVWKKNPPKEVLAACAQSGKCDK